MLVLGVIGGVASGKSLVARSLEQLGAVAIDADQLGHEVLREPEVVQKLRNRWGPDILGADGQIVRAAVARRVFSDDPAGARELAFLESCTHGRIRARLEQKLAQLRSDGRVPAVVLDAALLLRAGWDQYCDRILFVNADVAARASRAQQRGWTAAEWHARESAQESLEAKRDRSDWVIENSGTPEQTLAQVKAFWQAAGLPLPEKDTLEVPDPETRLS